MRNLNRTWINAGITLVVWLVLALIFLLTPYKDAPELDEAESRLRLLVIWVTIGYLAALVLVVRGWLSPFARRLLIGLAVIHIGWMVIYLIFRGEVNFGDWFFSPSVEYAFGAIFSSTQLLLIALSAGAVLPLIQPRAPIYRFYWLFLGVGFAFLAADEYFSFHETYDFWRTGYMLIGAGVVILSALVGWFGYRDRWQVFALIIIGFGLMGFSGVVMDAFANDHPLEFGSVEINAFRCAYFKFGVECQSYPIVEEFLELAGEGFILLAILTFAQPDLPEVHWRLVRRVLAGAAAIWVAFTLFSLFLFEMIEEKLSAEAYSVSYLDGALTLEGYELSHIDRIKPGDTLTGTFYFAAHQGIPANYYLSVHLLTKPDETLAAQEDLQLGDWKYPTSAWLPGLSVGTDVEIKIPDDLPTPATYWLMVRVWKGPDLDDGIPLGEDIVIEQEGLRLIKPDTFILRDYVALSDDPPPDPTTPVSYAFNDGFTLYGYDMPSSAAAGGTLDMRFWWRDERRTRQLIHYVHLFPKGGGDPLTFDRQSFEGKFPPEDWLPGIQVMDEWQIDLPADMPPGAYDVVTGMYEFSSKERVIVFDSAGQPVPDYSIPLGTVTVEAGG